MKVLRNIGAIRAAGKNNNRIGYLIGQNIPVVPDKKFDLFSFSFPLAEKFSIRSACACLCPSKLLWENRGKDDFGNMLL